MSSFRCLIYLLLLIILLYIVQVSYLILTIYSSSLKLFGYSDLGRKLLEYPNYPLKLKNEKSKSPLHHNGNIQRSTATTSALPAVSLNPPLVAVDLRSATTQLTLSNHRRRLFPVKGIHSRNSYEMELSSLTGISPLDGRYWNKVKDLARYLSEYGLIYFRNLVEVKRLNTFSFLKLSDQVVVEAFRVLEVVEVPSFQLKLQGLIDGFNIGDAIEVERIERTTNHDVKAVEYFLKTKCQEDPEIAKVLEFFHFGCTSEDINNIAHG